MQPGGAPDENFVPIYVQVRSRSGWHGWRNLLAGGFFFLLALVLAVFGNLVAGQRALVPLATCLVACGLLWMMARARLFKQRNGPFFALAVLSFVGASVAVLEHGYDVLAGNLAARGEPVAEEAAPATLAPVVELPLLTSVPGVAAPGTVTGPAIKVLHDTRVLIGRKSYQLKAGDIFPFEEEKEGEVVFVAGELHPRIARDAVELVGQPSPEEPARMSPKELDAVIAAADKESTPAQITQRSQKEAIRRYPALGVKNSPENEIFVETYRELRNTGSELLKDPEWPLDIAEMLARKEGWERK